MKNSIELLLLLRAEVEMKEHEIRKMQSVIADKEKQQTQIELDHEDSDEYKALQDEIDQLQSDIEDLENEIEDLESEIVDLTE